MNILELSGIIFSMMTIDKSNCKYIYVDDITLTYLF